jgi:hypothetical protein
LPELTYGSSLVEISVRALRKSKRLVELLALPLMGALGAAARRARARLEILAG